MTRPREYTRVLSFSEHYFPSDANQDTFMTVIPRHAAIPDLIRLGRQVTREALLHCAANPALPCLAAVDGTCGNGHDTLFLAETLAEIGGRKPHGVFAFDVQPAAIEAARARLGALAGGVTLLLASHARLAEELARPENRPASLAGCGAISPPPIALAMYNLGFLPGSDKRVVTSAGDTLDSLRSVADLLTPHGLLLVHAYGGHAGGREELETVDAWHAALPFEHWTVARYALHNKARNPEALFLAEKRETS